MVERQSQQQPLIHIHTQPAPAQAASTSAAPVVGPAPAAAPAKKPLVAEPTDQEDFENKMNPGAVISAKMAAHTDSINNPFLRVGAKILSRIPPAFGDAAYPPPPALPDPQKKRG